jgi:hypothetical protein
MKSWGERPSKTQAHILILYRDGEVTEEAPESISAFYSSWKPLPSKSSVSWLIAVLPGISALMISHTSRYVIYSVED